MNFSKDPRECADGSRPPPRRLRAVLTSCRPDWDITAPERKRLGKKGARNSSIPTQNLPPKLSVNRIRAALSEVIVRDDGRQH